MDYSKYGLNRYLQSNTSIFSTGGGVSAYSFVSDAERASIPNYLIQDDAVNNRKIVSVAADKITAGTVLVSVTLGTSTAGTLILDGANNRIVVHDGTTNRIVIGNI